LEPADVSKDASALSFLTYPAPCISPIMPTAGGFFCPKMAQDPGATAQQDGPAAAAGDNLSSGYRCMNGAVFHAGFPVIACFPGLGMRGRQPASRYGVCALPSSALPNQDPHTAVLPWRGHIAGLPHWCIRLPVKVILAPGSSVSGCSLSGIACPTPTPKTRRSLNTFFLLIINTCAKAPLQG
jgi:hypothetical protein